MLQTPKRSKGSLGHAFAVSLRTEKRNQAGFCPSAPCEVSVLAELALGHLRYRLTDVPPQSNSPSGGVLGTDRARPYSGRELAGGKPTGVPGAREPLFRPPAPPETDPPRASLSKERTHAVRGTRVPPHRVSEETIKVVVFHGRKPPERPSHLFYAPDVSLLDQTRVKLNRVFFPR